MIWVIVVWHLIWLDFTVKYKNTGLALTLTLIEQLTPEELIYKKNVMPVI